MTGSDTGGNDEFLEVMRDTRARYVAGFADQLDHMRSLSAEAARDGQLAALRTVAHRLAGLSGTLGFRSVGSEAADLESLVEAALSGRPFDRDMAHEAIQRISDAFNRDLSNPPSWAAPAPAPAGSAPVMIVEDDDDQRALVRGYLEKAGFATIGVASGDAVMEAARRTQPRVVLLDVHLPGMDGYSVCRHLKADKDTRGIPVVFVTTRAAMNERLAGLTLGADDYLTKPVDMGELLLRVRRLTRDTTAAAPLPPASSLRSYEDWLDAARSTLASGSAAVALVRVPQSAHTQIADGLSDNLRRRDIVAAYDRSHLLVLLPEENAAHAAGDLRAILDRLDVEGTAAGIAAGAGGDPERLIAEADEALATARHTGERIATMAERSARPSSAAAQRTVLLADDDPDVMRIVDAQMQALGFKTTIAFDGQSALAGLAARPDVLVLDLMMPKMTGFEVLQQIARLDPPRPKVIVLSARGREDDVTRAFDLGADDYMVKPFSPQELGARIGRLLR